MTTDWSFFDEQEVTPDEQVITMEPAQVGELPEFKEEYAKEKELLETSKVKVVEDSDWSFFDAKSEGAEIVADELKTEVKDDEWSFFDDKPSALSLAELAEKGHITPNTSGYNYQYNPQKEEGTWSAGAMAGLDSTVSFNLAREGKAAFSGETLEKYSWLFGKMWKGDNPYTQDTVEEGWNFVSSLDEMGISQEEYDAMSHSERLVRMNKASKDWINHNNNPDTNRTAYTVAKFGGMLLTDPSILVPLKNPAQFIAYGASDASLYEHSTTGELSPATPVLGATLAYAGYKGGQWIVGKVTEKQAQKALTELQNELNRVVLTEKLNPFEALKLAKINLGLTDVMVNEALNVVRKKWDKSKKKNKKKQTLLQMPRNKEEAIKLIEAQSKAETVRRGSTTKAGETLDRVIEPISEGIHRLSPRLFGLIQRGESQQYQNAHKFAMMVEPFLKKAFGTVSPKLTKTKNLIKGKTTSILLNDAQQKELKHLMLSAYTKEDAKALDAWILKNGGESLLADWKVYRAAMDEIHNMRVAAGNTKLKKLEGYSPRRLLDYKLWMQNASEEVQGAIGQRIKAYKKKNNIAKDQKLSDRQLTEVISNFLRSSTKGGPAIRSATSAKTRSKNVISEAQTKAYADPWHAAHSYIRESMEEVTRFNTFGAHNIDKNDDIKVSVANYLAEQLNKGIIKNKDVDDLQKLLELRYVDGPQAMGKVLTTTKDIGYMSLLGSPTNALRQASDIAFSTYFNGFNNALKGVYSTLTKKLLSPKEMGIMDNTAAEFAHDTMSKRAVDFTFKYTGFRSIDAFGKGSLVNSTLHKAGQDVMSKAGQSNFMNKWSAVLGAEDAMKAMKDFQGWLKSGKKTKPTQLMKDIGFIQLTKVQPITLLEMPAKYLEMKNGRMFYMLRSFQLKHLNLMRQEGIKHLREGNIVKGSKNLAALTSMFVAANLPITMAIDWMLGRDQKDIEELLITELWRASSLLSKWDADKILEGNNLYDQAWEMGQPPVNKLAEAGGDILKMGYNFLDGENIFRTEGEGKDTGEALLHIAPFGNLINAWFVK